MYISEQVWICTQAHFCGSEVTHCLVCMTVCNFFQFRLDVNHTPAVLGLTPYIPMQKNILWENNYLSVSNVYLNYLKFEIILNRSVCVVCDLIFLDL